MCKVNPPQGTPVLPPGTYDVFYKNCNTFSDAALYFLTGTRMPACYNRIERFVTATKPVSVGLLNVIFKAMVEHNSGVTVEGDIYTPNPLSADFSVDSLIKQLEGHCIRAGDVC